MSQKLTAAGDLPQIPLATLTVRPQSLYLGSREGCRKRQGIKK